jgi:hypothetical protein
LVKLYLREYREINLVEILRLMRLILKNTPLGCFSGKAEKRDFAPCGFSSAELRSAKLRSAKLNWRPVALSSSAAQP